MGNSLIRFIYGQCCKPSPQSPPHDSQLGHHGVTPATVGVSALAHDLFHFDITNQVPDGLSKHVVSSRKAQANWYKKLLEAWREAKPPPKTPEAAARLIVQTLKRHHKADVEGLLAFYGLPTRHTLEVAAETSGAAEISQPDGVKYELRTLPVSCLLHFQETRQTVADMEGLRATLLAPQTLHVNTMSSMVDVKAIADGDTITVYVDTSDPRESSNVPRGVHEATVARAKARAIRDYKKADALHKSIVDAGYRVINGPNGEETLAKKYRIRLRGIDAPESAMPYGKEAKEELVKLVQGKTLTVHVYGDDLYGRCVGDIYCNGVFVQEKMLKKGCAWHYAAYDRRPQLAAWEQEARHARVGLWASSNPEKPWEWRKERRNGA